MKKKWNSLKKTKRMRKQNTILKFKYKTQIHNFRKKTNINNQN